MFKFNKNVSNLVKNVANMALAAQPTKINCNFFTLIIIIIIIKTSSTGGTSTSGKKQNCL